MVWQRTEIGTDFEHSGITFTSDSRHFFAPSGSRISLFRTETGEVVSVFQGHEDTVLGLYLLPTQKDLCLSYSRDGTVIIWNTTENAIREKHTIGGIIKQLVLDPNDPNTAYYTQGNKEIDAKMRKYNFSTKENQELKEISVHHPKRFAIHQSGNFLVFFGHKKEYGIGVAHLQSKEVTFNNKHKNISALALRNDIVVIGLDSGMINMLRFGRSKAKLEFVEEFHWHSSSVRSLAFSNDGSYLYSGGHECTLVLRNIENTTNNFLPRLGGSIEHISQSPEGEYYGLVLSNNSIVIVNAISLKIQSTIRGLRPMPPSPNKIVHAILAQDPRTNLMVYARDNLVQFYDPFSDRLVREIDAAPYNQYSSMKEPPIRVTHCCMSFDGKDMITAETTDILGENQVSLQFWKWNSSDYVLNTRVDRPHEREIHGMASSPTLPLVVTTGADRKFKIWAQVKHATAKSASWACRSVITFRNMEPRKCAFSTDGSLLAVQFKQMTTLWNPLTNQFLQELSHNKSEWIQHLVFIPNSPYLVVASNTHIYVWNLLSFSIQWTYEGRALEVVPDSTGKHVLMYFRTSHLGTLSKAGTIVLFDIETGKPSNIWRITVPIIAMQYLSPKMLASHKSSAASSILCLTEGNRFLFLEEFQISHSIQAEQPPVVPVPKLESGAPDILKDLFGVSQPARPIQERREEIIAPTVSPLDQLFDAPTHVLPSLETLYQSFMDVLLIKEDTNLPLAAAGTNKRDKKSSTAMEIDRTVQNNFDRESNDKFVLSFFMHSFGQKPAQANGNLEHKEQVVSQKANGNSVHTPSKKSKTKAGSSTPNKTAQ